jgi:hypothetical protein
MGRGGWGGGRGADILKNNKKNSLSMMRMQYFIFFANKKEYNKLIK